MPSSSELKSPSSSSSGGEGSDIGETKGRGSHSKLTRRRRKRSVAENFQSQESPSTPGLTLSPEQRAAIEHRLLAARAGQSQSHVDNSSGRQTLGLQDERQVLSPLAARSPPLFAGYPPLRSQLDQATLLQLELQQQQQRNLQRWQQQQQQQQSMGLLVPALGDNALQATAYRLLNNNALSLLQLQQQQHQHQQSLLSPLAQTQPDWLAANAAAAIQAQQQLQLARQQQLQQQEQQQRLWSAASLPLSHQDSRVLDPSFAMALGASYPPVAPLPDVSHHLLQRVPPAGSAAGLAQHQHRFSYSSSGSGSSSSSSSNKASPPPPLPELKKPKRPLSSYNYFFKASRKKLRTEEPDIGFEELAKRIGKQWGEIDAETLAPYEEEAQKDRERYWRELEVYKVNMNAQLEKKRAARKKSSDDLNKRYFAKLKSEKKQKRL